MHGQGLGPLREPLLPLPRPCWVSGPWKSRSPAGTGEKQGPGAHLGSFLGRGQHSAIGTEDHAGLTLLTLEPEQRSQGGQLQGEGPPTPAAEPQLWVPTNTHNGGMSAGSVVGSLGGSPICHTEVTKRRTQVRICPRRQVGRASAQVPAFPDSDPLGRPGLPLRVHRGDRP